MLVSIFLAQASEQTIKSIIKRLSNPNHITSINKGRSSVLGEDARPKRWLCKDALMHRKFVDNFDFEWNTKETQTEVTLENFSDFQFETHSVKHVGFGVQCCIENLEKLPSCTLDMLETKAESEFCQESNYVDSDVCDNEEYKQITSPSNAVFIVYWTSVTVLLENVQ